MTESSPIKRRGSYVFGSFVLASDGTLLLREGRALPLAPKILQTLRILVERPGEVVTKAELLAAVWPNSIVEETGLSRNVSLLRRALGEPYVATVSRVGYRFTGSVRYEASVTRGAVLVDRARESPVQGGPTEDVWGMTPDRRADHRLIVGRREPLARLSTALEETGNGGGRLLGCAGEPGIGKSAVVERFLANAGTECAVGVGRCSERLSGAEPHLPLLEALQDLVEAAPLARALLRRLAPTWEEAIAPARRASETSQRGGEVQAFSPGRLYREVTTFLEALSRNVPVVLVLEDLHWSDAATVDVLAHLAARLRRMRVLLVVTYRRHDLTRTQHPFRRLRLDLLARAGLQELDIGLLTPQDVHEYVVAMLQSEAGAPALSMTVYQRSEGNPLFMVQLVRCLREHQATDTTLDSTTSALPRTVGAMVERALDSLGDDLRTLLSIAAVLGQEFDSATLADVSGFGMETVEEQLGRGEQAHGVIVRDREAALPNRTAALRYRFVHVLYQEALYAALTPSRRKAWASRLAGSLTRSHGAVLDTIAGRLAVLFEAAGELWAASGHYAKASRTAVRRFAFREAGELASRGLDCLQRGPAAEPQALREREAELTLARYVAVGSLTGYGNLELESLLGRLRVPGDVDPTAPVTAAALMTEWGIRMARGECAAAKDAGDRLASIASDPGDPVLALSASLHRQIACHHLGEFEEAARHAAEIARQAPSLAPGARLLTIYDPLVASLAESSRNLWITGHLSLAVDEASSAVCTGLAVGHPDSLAFAWLFQGWLHGHQGAWEACLDASTAGLRVASETALAQTHAWNRCVKGWALAHLEQMEEGLATLGEGIQASRRIMGWVAMPQFSAMMAEVLLLRRDPVAAAAWLGEAHDFMHSHQDLYYGAEVYRLLAACMFDQKQEDAGIEYLRRALALAQSQQAHTFEVRAAIALAERRPLEGMTVLSAALTSFPDPQPWADLRRATALVGCKS